MTSELKTKWLEALRSGRYQQGTRWLQQNEKFCCLGVLCEVSKLPRRDGYYVWKDESLWNLAVPDELLAGRFQNVLMNLNDTREESFLVIANWIEVNLIPKDAGEGAK